MRCVPAGISSFGKESTMDATITAIVVAIIGAAGAIIAAVITNRNKEPKPAAVVRQVSRSNVLWVDDKNPGRNLQERNSLEARGVDFTPATTTEEALEKIQGRSFDAIISDMGRPGDANAGLTLLGKLRAVGNKTPFIIYTGSKADQLWSQAREKGAFGCTNSRGELSELVLSAIRRPK
jgi:CheY-like chemotaxis protein